MSCSLLACHNADLWQKPQPIPPTMKDLAAVDTQTLTTVNSAQSDTVTAAQVAFEPPATAPTGRVQQLAQLITNGKCTQTKTAAGTRYDHPWQGEWEVSSDSCPVLVHEYSAFDFDHGIWRYDLTLTPISTDFKKLAGFDSIRAHGSIKTANGANGLRSASGQIVYQPFTVAGVGQVNAQITVTPTGSSSGLVILDFTANSTTVRAVGAWDGTNRQYTVNQKPMDFQTFQQLFSSFQITDLMDRAANLL